MRQDLRRFRSALLLILAFSLGLGAQLLQAQVSVSPSRSRFSATIAPSTNDGAALGTTALGWSDLHLATGAVINWANGEITLTETDANTLTLAGGQLVIPAGSLSLPSLANVTDSTTGMYFNSGSSIDFTVGGVRLLAVQAGGLITVGTHTITLGDTALTQESGNVFQQGADAATPAAQTFKGPDARAGTDTDTVGGNYTIAPGRGTGNANSGKLIFAFSNPGASGTQGNPLMSVASFSASGGHFLLPELAVDPSTPNMTADGEIAVYTKNDKLVFAYNNGGIMTFLSLALDGSATTWVHSTTAP